MTIEPTQSRALLHIGKFYWPHMGGIESHVRDLVRRQSLEYKVDVVVANDTKHYEESHLDGARITRIPTFGSIASMSITPTLAWNIARRKADIVHVHLPNPWAALAILLSGHTGKVVITHHGDTLGRESLRKVADPIVALLMRRAAAIIVSSEGYLKSSMELAEFRDKCKVVPLGLDYASFQDADQAHVAEIRAKYGEKIILSVGRLVPYKGVRYLIESMKDVDGCLLHIGKGPAEAQLLQQARDQGVSDKVHLLGRVDNIAPYLHAACMFVLPSVSRAESFGIVQLEAMAAALPIINTDIESGVPEVSLHGLTGLTVPPADAVSLAGAINLLLDDKEMRRRFGEAGRARVRREFSIDNMAEQTREIYEGVLEGRKGKPATESLRLPKERV